MLGVPNFDRTANIGSAAERREQEWRGMAPHLYTFISSTLILYCGIWNLESSITKQVPVGLVGSWLTMYVLSEQEAWKWTWIPLIALVEIGKSYPTSTRKDT